MKKLFVSFMLLASIVSCKKEEEPIPVPEEKTYTVEYKITASPRAGTTLSGDITYVSKTSSTTTATFSGNSWSVTETGWKLKSGDVIGFQAPLANIGSFEASLLIDGRVWAYEQLTNYVGPTPFKIVLQHKVF